MDSYYPIEKGWLWYLSLTVSPCEEVYSNLTTFFATPSQQTHNYSCTRTQKLGWSMAVSANDIRWHKVFLQSLLLLQQYSMSLSLVDMSYCLSRLTCCLFSVVSLSRRLLLCGRLTLQDVSSISLFTCLYGAESEFSLKAQLIFLPFLLIFWSFFFLLFLSFSLSVGSLSIIFCGTKSKLTLCEKSEG